MPRAIFVLILLASATVGALKGSDPFDKKSQGRLSSGLNRRSWRMSAETLSR